MDRKKVAIIAILLFLGLGTFVFAGPSESLKTDDNTTYEGGNSTSDGTNSSINNSGNVSNNDNDINNNINDLPNTSDDENDDINDIMIGNNSASNSSTNKPNNNQTTSSNNQNNNSGVNNGSGVTAGSSNNTNSGNNSNANPTNPDNNSNNNGNNSETNENNNIKNLLNELSNLVTNAKNKDDIIFATVFRNSNDLNEKINNIADNTIKNEYLAILNNLNKILDDIENPLISGVTDGSYVKNVSINITDSNIKTILLNGTSVTLDDIKNIKQDGKYTIIVYDAAYNESKVTFTIDNIAPEAVIAYSTTSLTNQDVSITINANEEIKPIDGWVLSDNKMSISKIVSSNTIENITIYDLAGNVKNISYSVNNIDKTSPVINVTTANEGDNVLVTISANKELQALNGWNLSADRKTLSKLFTENTSGSIQVYDLAGNMTIASYTVDSVVKPELKIEVNKDIEEITNQDVTVTITSNRKIKPVDGWNLSDDELSLTKTYSSNNEEKITIYDASDENISIAETIIIENIDKIAPEYVISTTIEQNQTILITITTNEKIKNVPNWNLSEDQKTLTKSFPLNSEGTVTISDLAGNEVTIPYKASIDFEIPTDVVVSTSNNGDRTNLDVVVTITTNQEVEPIPGWEISEDRKVLTKSFSEDISGFVFLTYTDGTTIYVPYKVVNINKIIPEIIEDNIKYSPSTPTNGEVIVEITATKPILTPPNGWAMVPGTGALVFTKTFTTNTSEEIILRDLYGNVGYATITVNNIDKTAPKIVSITTSNNDGSITTNNVTVTITANKELQEIGDGWSLSEDRFSISKVFYNNVEDGSVLITDLAGNSVIANYKVLGIDNEVTGITTKTSNNDDRTNRDVIVTITADEQLKDIGNGWILSEDQFSISKTFESNTAGTVIIEDLYGNKVEVPYKVVNINKIIPEVPDDSIKYSLDENNNVVVEITATKPILTPPNGWAMVSGTGALVFTKTYQEANIEEVAILRDLYGNVGQVTININKAVIAKESGSFALFANEMTNTCLSVITR